MSPMPEFRQTRALRAIRTGVSALLLQGMFLMEKAGAQTNAAPAAKPIHLVAPAAAAASGAPPTARIAPPSSATLAPPASAVPPAKTKPPKKQTPKPGPGANDAGANAANLQTTTLPLFSLIDRNVVGQENRQIGHVVDVLVNAKGEPAALVVDVGGFLGMGNRRIAIGWERFVLAGRKSGAALRIPFSDAQIKSAPAYGGLREVSVVQGAVHRATAAAAGTSISSSRVNLGEDPGPLSTDKASSANSLNPD